MTAGGSGLRIESFPVFNVRWSVFEVIKRCQSRVHCGDLQSSYVPRDRLILFYILCSPISGTSSRYMSTLSSLSPSEQVCQP